MNKFSVCAPAKINLSLHIGERLPGGYHEVETIMYKLPLADVMTVELLSSQESDEVICDQALVPTGEANLINKALRLLRARVSLPACRIHLQKNIPVAAGLAGGSSDAGSLLVALNDECGLGLTPDRLTSLALQLGADVPFFTRNDNVTREIHHGLPTLQSQPLSDLPPCRIVTIYQATGLDTAAMYAAWDSEILFVTDRSHTISALDALQTHSLPGIAAALHNDFYQLAVSRVPAIKKAHDTLVRAGALGVNLTGKGPTIFGLFPPGVAIDEKLLRGFSYQVFDLESAYDPT